MNGRIVKEAAAGYELTVYLPISYSEGQKRYPVVYVQDGGEIVHAGYNYLDHLFITGQLPEIIFIGIQPQNRNTDYTPWPASPLMPGLEAFGGGAMSYLKVLVEEIKPFVDGVYLTRPEPEHTGIAGCSFGGLLAAYASLEYPETFGKYALLSASFWYEHFLEYMECKSLSEHERRIYMYVGELEGKYKRSIQQNMVAYTREAHALLLQKGIPAEQLKFDTDPCGTHDDFFFTRYFMNALLWLFSPGGTNHA